MDIAGNGGVALLIDVEDHLAGRLKEALSGRGVLALRLAGRDVVAGALSIPLNAVSATGLSVDLAGNGADGHIRPRGQPGDIPLDRVCATFAGYPDVRELDAFDRAEHVAVLHAVRMRCANPINPGGNGSDAAFMLSLPEQWCRCAKHGIEHPAWRVAPPGLPPGTRTVDGSEGSADTQWLGLVDLYDRSLRQAPDEGDAVIRVEVRRPRGAFVLCAFAGSELCLARRVEEGMIEFELTGEARHAVACLVQAVRQAFALDYGELVFSYLGRPLFWSVAPGLSEEVLARRSSALLVAALADRVACRGAQ